MNHVRSAIPILMLLSLIATACCGDCRPPTPGTALHPSAVAQGIDGSQPPETSQTAETGQPQQGGQPALARGINFAGDLEVEPRGSWGKPILADDFALAAAQGFDHIRLPIRWSSNVGPAPDYAIAPELFAEVDSIVQLAEANGLTIVIDVHHFEELNADPVGERARFLAIWEQLAAHFVDAPPTVVFELLNEPTGVFDDRPELWNGLLVESLAIVRRTHPNRTVIVGPVGYNHADRLPDLDLPDDPNLVATVHVYDPTSFTVQGAVFIEPVPPTGITWRADNASVAFGWQQQSWDVALAPSTAGIEITWDRTWAAFAVGVYGEPRAAEWVEVSASQPFEARVLCNYHTDNQIDADVIWDGTTGRADLSECGQAETLALQQAGGELEAVALARLAVCADVCDEIVTTQQDALDQLISGAADWAEAEGVPLYVGEFGTYEPIDVPTDPESRFAWTNAVRTISEENGAGWAYFAMNDEFGAFDRDTGTWIPEIVDALFD